MMYRNEPMVETVSPGSLVGIHRAPNLQAGGRGFDPRPG